MVDDLIKNSQHPKSGFYLDNYKELSTNLEELENEKCKIQIKGFIGSSKSILAASIIKQVKSPQLFILNDKETATYFINDLENLLNHEIFFYPASYRRAYQLEETDNANILLRSEVLNKLNNKRNPIIITYSKALSEKVVSRKVLKKQTISLKLNDKYEISDLEQTLLSLHFEKFHNQYPLLLYHLQCRHY